MAKRVSSNKIIIKQQDNNGAVLCKLSGDSPCLIPSDIANHDELKIESVTDMSDYSIDTDAVNSLPSELSDLLKNHGYHAIDP